MAKVLNTDGISRCIGCFTCMLVCAGVNQQNHSLAKSRIRIRTTGGLKSPFVSIVCLACTGVRACAEICPSGALENRPGGGVWLKPERCIGCRKCVQACIIGAVNFDETAGKPLICKHCGVCSRFCPHDCLTMEDVANDL